MKTLILIVACIGVGYGFANYQFQKRTSGKVNILGSDADMDATIKKNKANVTPPGKIEVVSGPEFDFGTMKRGTRRTHTFILKNVGGAPVELENKGSTCKCTVGSLDAKKVGPGEEVPVKLDWLAEGQLAEFAQTATIGTSVLDQEEIKLVVKGLIGQAYVFSPPSADLREFLASDENEISGRLYSFEEEVLEIASAVWSENSLASKITCETEPAKKLESGEVPGFADARYYVNFKVRLAKGISAGTLSGNVVFNRKSASEDSKVEPINFPIQGRSVSAIRVIGGPDYNEERNILSLGTASTKVGLKKSFVLAIKNEDAKDLQIHVGKVTPEKAESALKVSVAEVKSASKQKMFSVTLEIPPGGAPVECGGTHGKDFAKIVLETNMESAPQFPMFIKFRISE